MGNKIQAISGSTYESPNQSAAIIIFHIFDYWFTFSDGQKLMGAFQTLPTLTHQSILPATVMALSAML